MFFGQNLDFPKITKIPKDLGKIMQIMSNLAQTIHRVVQKNSDFGEKSDLFFRKMALSREKI